MNAPAQLSPEWFAARVSMLTGSRIGAALGVNPYQSPDDLLRIMVREYHGAESEFTGNHFTEWGQAHEADAISVLEIERGLMVADAPLVHHPEIKYLAASPDGFTSDGGLIECKCPQTIKALEDVPHYWHQMQLQMHCTGKSHCWFVQWTPDASHSVKVPIDTNWLADYIADIERFMARYHETITSEELSKPHLEPLVIEREDDEWTTAAEQLRDVSAQIKELQSIERATKDLLIDMAGGRKSAGGGVTVYPTTRKTTDYKTLIKDAGVDASQYQKEATSWTVRCS